MLLKNMRHVSDILLHLISTSDFDDLVTAISSIMANGN